MLLSLWPNYWEDWQLYHKVTFDGVNKLITINPDETEINVKIDLYSDWKEWLLVRENGTFPQAFRTSGGDPINPSTGRFTGTTYFLMNGWKIRSWDGDHILNVDGNLFPDEPDIYGLNLFIPTLRPYTVAINLTTSNLVDTLNFPQTGLANAVWNELLESGYTGKDLMRLFAAALLGKVSGMDLNNPAFRDVNDTTDRILANTTTDGNRITVTLDPS